MTIADRIWNRAAMEHGGTTLCTGDRALASLLRVHGLVMNGGVHHALESVNTTELSAAADGYAFFGLHNAAGFFRRVSDDPGLSQWTDDTEVEANLRYESMIPNDSYLDARFQEVLRARATEFAPLDDD